MLYYNNFSIDLHSIKKEECQGSWYKEINRFPHARGYLQKLGTHITHGNCLVQHDHNSIRHQDIGQNDSSTDENFHGRLETERLKRLTEVVVNNI